MSTEKSEELGVDQEGVRQTAPHLSTARTDTPASGQIAHLNKDQRDRMRRAYHDVAECWADNLNRYINSFRSPIRPKSRVAKDRRRPWIVGDPPRPAHQRTGEYHSLTYGRDCAWAAARDIDILCDLLDASEAEGQIPAAKLAGRHPDQVFGLDGEGNEA